MLEYDLNSKMENEKREVANTMEAMREDRKDQRVDQQAQHQMNMIEQRKQGDSTKKFESSGNDILSGGANMERFGL